MILVQRVGGTDGESHPVETDWIVRTDSFQCAPGDPVLGKIVFAMRLEPRDGRAAVDDFAVIGSAEADPGGCRDRFRVDSCVLDA